MTRDIHMLNSESRMSFLIVLASFPHTHTHSLSLSYSILNGSLFHQIESSRIRLSPNINLVSILSIRFIQRRYLSNFQYNCLSNIQQRLNIFQKNSIRLFEFRLLHLSLRTRRTLSFIIYFLRSHFIERNRELGIERRAPKCVSFLQLNNSTSLIRIQWNPRGREKSIPINKVSLPLSACGCGVSPIFSRRWVNDEQTSVLIVSARVCKFAASTRATMWCETFQHGIV